MSLSIDRYVSITSSVGAGVNASTRDLVGRFFTGNLLLPPNTFVSFTTAAQVGAFFGLLSEEYLRAVFYFSWVSKNITQAGSIQFARWVSASVAPRIYSAPGNGSLLTNWTSIANGSLGLNIGGTFHEISTLDFTSAASLADVATVIQTAIQLQSGTMWTSATVTYDGNGGFNFVGGSQIAATISVQPGTTGTDITGAGKLGWTPGRVYSISGAVTSGAYWCAGSLLQTLTSLLDTSASVSNNFGSFAFLNNLNLNITQITEAASWNYGQDNTFLYSVPVLDTNKNSWSSALADIGGVCLTLIPDATIQNGLVTSASPTVTGLLNALTTLKVGMPVSGTNIAAGTVIQGILSDTSITLSANATGTGTVALTFTSIEFQEQIPMMIEAATDYDAVNAVQNYMYQTNFVGINPTVFNDSSADVLDNLKINYYGSAQTAGQILNFYQRGVMQGPASSPADINVYVNEIWLKDAISVVILNLFLNLTQIAANEQGRSQILSVLQSVINQAVNNGTISVNKMLTSTQKEYIAQVTGESDAWYQVQTIGYWLDCEIVSDSSSPPIYTAVYTLVYSKDDIVRKVDGRNILI